jgi:hydroxymethylglutaryl-CoA lyase
MGCYEVSLGDTVGMGTQESVREMLGVVRKDVPLDLLVVRTPCAFNL